MTDSAAKRPIFFFRFQVFTEKTCFPLFILRIIMQKLLFIFIYFHRTVEDFQFTTYTARTVIGFHFTWYRTVDEFEFTCYRTIDEFNLPAVGRSTSFNLPALDGRQMSIYLLARTVSHRQISIYLPSFQFTFYQTVNKFQFTCYQFQPSDGRRNFNLPDDWTQILLTVYLQIAGKLKFSDRPMESFQVNCNFRTVREL